MVKGHKVRHKVSSTYIRNHYAGYLTVQYNIHIFVKPKKQASEDKTFNQLEGMAHLLYLTFVCFEVIKSAQKDLSDFNENEP